MSATDFCVFPCVQFACGSRKFCILIYLSSPIAEVDIRCSAHLESFAQYPKKVVVVTSQLQGMIGSSREVK